MDVETAVRERIPILTILLNNSAMGNYEKFIPVATARYRTKFTSGRYYEVVRGLGAYSERIERPGDVAAASKGESNRRAAASRPCWNSSRVKSPTWRFATDPGYKNFMKIGVPLLASGFFDGRRFFVCRQASATGDRVRAKPFEKTARRGASNGCRFQADARYSHKTFIDRGRGICEVDCSGFIVALLQQIALEHLGATAMRTRPLAEDFYATFARERRYRGREAGCASTRWRTRAGRSDCLDQAGTRAGRQHGARHAR